MATKRENGFGSIKKRNLASGIRYTALAPARYEVADDGTVRCVRDSIGTFKRRAEAAAALEEYRRHPTTKYNFTLAQLHDLWERNAYDDLAQQTVDNWTSAWKQIDFCKAPHLPEMMVREILVDDMRSVIKFYSRPFIGKDGKERKALSSSSLSKIKALLTQLYDYALEEKITDQNYAKLIKLPKAEKAEARAFTDLEFAKLEKAFADGVPNSDALLVLCYTGLRITELCSMTPFSYDRHRQILTGGLKTDAGKDRIVPVHPRIRPILDRWADRGCATLYANQDGKPYTKDSFRRRVMIPTLAAIGLPDDLTAHSCRHTCATRLAAAGARPEDIKKIMGHADYSTTADVYIQQDVATLAEAVNMVK